ncbi:MAG: hypothetical protein RL736_687, partial [Pseudomonadota bacterium]
HDAVERQEPVRADPVEDAVVLNDALRRHDRGLRADGVELERRCTADVRHAQQAVG